MLVEKGIIFMGIIAFIFYIFRLRDTKNKEDKLLMIIGMLLGFLITGMGEYLLSSKKNYINKIETFIETNSTDEEEEKEEFLKELEKIDTSTLEFMYKDLKHKFPNNKTEN